MSVIRNGLFLDDERTPSCVTWILYPKNIKWDVVVNYSEFVNAINTKNYDLISFDHDLHDFNNGVEYTGKHCINFLIDYLLDSMDNTTIPDCFFHSKNPIGTTNMSKYWNNFLQHIQEPK